MKTPYIIFAVVIALAAVGGILYISQNQDPELVPVATEEVVLQQPVATSTATSTATTTPVTPEKPVVVTPPVVKPPVVTPPVVKPPVVVTPPAPTEKTFTMSQVAQHDSEEDCYSAINGTVYDLSAYVNRHPGGDRNILRICGIDGSNAFDNQHGGESKPERILAGFEVGTLK